VGCFGGLVSLSLFSLYSFCFIISRFLVLIWIQICYGDFESWKTS
jgi:hypothetical protein